LNFSSWRKIHNRIKNLKGTDWLIVLLVGVLLLVVAIPTGSSTGGGQTSDASEYAQGSGTTAKSGGMANSSTTASSITGSSTKSGTTASNAEAAEWSIEEELADILSSMEGVGKVKVMITWKGEEGSDVEGVFVVAEGAGNAAVCADILSAVQSLFSIEAHKITIAKMSVSEGAN
jgi:stage III sporulation protein AG